jgi:hypothetical protein
MLRAQNDVLFTNPYDGQVDVSPSTSIRVRAPSPIEASSVVPQYPQAARQLAVEPTILVVRSSVTTTMKREQWSRHGIVGTVTLVDPTTLEWTPRRLLPNTTYHCIVQGLVMATGLGGVAIPTYEFDFTTAADVPRLAGSTFDTIDVLRCNAIVWFRTTQPIPYDVSVNQLLEIQQPTAGGVWAPSQQALVQRVSDTLLCVVPQQRWNTGVPLRIDVRMSQITGNPDDDRQLEATVRGAAPTHIAVVSEDGRPVPQELQDIAQSASAIVPADGNISIAMPPYFGERWRFIRWRSSSLSWADTVRTSTIRGPVSCEELAKPIMLSAEYAFVDTIDVVITTDTLGVVSVTDQDGRHLATVRDSTTLRLDTSIQQIFVVASATTGAAFLSWSASASGCSGSTAPSLNLPVSTLILSAMPPGTPSQFNPGGGASSNQPHVFLNPRFQKLTPVVGDRYRLRARLMNAQPDELQTIAEHVQFTTPNEFEETRPQTRTVCVIADEYWEVIGYHDASTGPPVWFDRGRHELCIDAPLLDPENTLVIFGRRVPIDLRLERVLLGSDHDDDVLLDRRPHPETRTDVETLVRVDGIEHWFPVPTSTCVVNGIESQRAGLRCGDKVRIVVSPAAHRGEDWRWWSNLPRYVQPRAADSVDGHPAYHLTMKPELTSGDAKSCDGEELEHREISLRAAFRKRFTVESIALRVRVNARGDRWRSFFEERWFDPLTYYDKADDEPRGGRQLEYIPRRGTSVKLKFSRPVDATTIYEGGISAESFANVLITDPQEKNLDFITASSGRGNAQLFSTTGQYLDIVEFSVYEPGTTPIKQALHTGMIDLTCSTSIRSADDEPLLSSRFFALRRMEIPGYGMRMTDAVFAFDGDTDWLPWEDSGEMYHALYGINIAASGAANQADGFHRYPDCQQQQTWSGDCTRDCGDEGDVFSFGDHPIWLQTAWMDIDDRAFARIGSWDEDCKSNDQCLVNRLQDVLDTLRGKAEQYKRDQVNNDNNKLIGDLVSLGATLIKALLPIEEQDDPLAEVTVLEDSQTLWGMSTPTAPRILVNTENADYRLRGQWFVSRSVVR